MTTRVSLQRCPKPVGVVFPTRVILRNGSPRLLFGEVRGRKLDQFADVKWEVLRVVSPHHQLVGTSKGWGKYQLRPVGPLKPWS